MLVVEVAVAVVVVVVVVALFSAFHTCYSSIRTMQTLLIAISINPSTGKQALYFACVTVSSGTCILLYF